MSPLEEIIKKCLKEKVKTEKKLADIKRWAASVFKISFPSNVKLFEVYQKMLKKGKIKRNLELELLLRKRKIRSLSGVVVVSVLTKPFPCPGKCIFCPKEKGIPKSYVSGEPAVERAKELNFNPFLQMRKRLESLEKQGHPTDKVEVRIIGGTFSAYPERYKNWFIASLFAGANRKTLPKKLVLEKEQKKNEKAKHRIVCLSIETRPDLINENEIKKLRKLGVTLVELGIQTVDENILKLCQRGHGVKEIIKATKLLKDAGFKVMYQVMPNLPASNLKKDFQIFKKIFEDENFKPDWLKIYPCVATEGTLLYRWLKKGKWKPYSDKELIELLIKIKSIVPRWIRIARIYRDIPAQKIKGGCKISNLREVVKKEMEKRKISCNCIRCREIKMYFSSQQKLKLFREDYWASGGKEIFLSFETEDRKYLFSFLRLRIPSQIFKKENHFLSVLSNSAIIREIHTYGFQVPLKKREKISPQHRGLGRKLVRKAEKIVKEEFNLSRIAVISGIGVRDYWRKLGYRLKETYMIKRLK